MTNGVATHRALRDRFVPEPGAGSRAGQPGRPSIEEMQAKLYPAWRGCRVPRSYASGVDWHGMGRSNHKGPFPNAVLCVERPTWKFRDADAAAKAIGRSKKSMYAALCRGTTCASYHWRYADAAKTEAA